MNRMKGRTALITGGSRGIGRAIAERFVSEGANVAINYMSNADAATEVAEAAAEHGVEARIYQANAGVEADCVRLANEVMRDFQQATAIRTPVDYLIQGVSSGTSIDTLKPRFKFHRYFSTRIKTVCSKTSSISLISFKAAWIFFSLAS